MNRTVLVTGGGTGFGRAIAAQFAKDGSQVYITGRRRELLEEAAQRLGGGVIPLTCDGTDPVAVAETAARIDGHVDVLVNNAGSNSSQTGGDLTDVANSWRANFESNVLTSVLMTAALDDKLRPGGALIHLGSLSAERGGAYGAAKAALAAWGSGIAAEYGPRDITSNVVAPGYVPTTDFFTEALPQVLHEQVVAQTALGRPGTIDEIVGSVYFLASPAARYITGQVLEVNGGSHRTR